LFEICWHKNSNSSIIRKIIKKKNYQKKIMKKIVPTPFVVELSMVAGKMPSPAMPLPPPPGPSAKLSGGPRARRGFGASFGVNVAR
jgi:hypothetical protein